MAVFICVAKRIGLGYTALMKRRKRRSKADIITSVLYVIFGILVCGVLYGAGSIVYALLGTTVGNSYYAGLAEDMRVDDSVDFTALAAVNPEIKAWVRLDDTAVDLPIVQTTDNSFYLTHRFDEKKNKLGTPFIDTSNAGDFSDRHTVVYGHAIRSGALFGSLWEYENPNYYERHPEMTLYLADGEQYTLAVFSCARVTGVRSEIPVSFSSDEAFLSFLDNLSELSAFTSSVKVDGSDRVLSFCVVAPDNDDDRLLISCKIEETDSSGVVTSDYAASSAEESTQEPEATPES